MENSNRLPWIIAFSSLFFAIGVLLTVLLMRGQSPPQAVQTVNEGRSEQRQGSGILPTPTVASTPAPTPSLDDTASALEAPPADASGGTRVQRTPAAEPVSTGYSISGTVTDLQGNGVPRATVQLFLDQRGSQVRVEVNADEQGQFESRNLVSPRVNSIVAEAPGYGRSESMPPFDLPVEGLEIALKRQATAELRILDAQESPENPLPYTGEATVYLMRPGGAGTTTGTLGSTGESERFEAIASETAVIRQGVYPLKGIDPGLYKAAVVVRGSVYAEGEPFTVDPETGGTGTVIVGQTQSLVGFVKSDPEQAPLPAVRVTLTAVGRPVVLGTPRPQQTVTQRDGRFSLDDVTPGNYRLTLATEGFTTKTFASIPVVAGPPPAPATFYLVRTEPMLEVAVYGPENRPMRNAPLVLISSGEGTQMKSWFGRTGQDGMYRFGPLQAGQYSLAVTAPDNRSRQKMLEVTVNEKDEITTEVIRFIPTVDVRGQVTRKGKPVEGLLSILPRGAVAPEIFAKTDSDGNYEVDLEPGEYMVGEARQEGRTILKVEPGDVQSADLFLP